MLFRSDVADQEFSRYYRVEALGVNPACHGPVSNCAATPLQARVQPYSIRVEETGAETNGIPDPGETVSDSASPEERVERLLAGFEAAAPMPLAEFEALAAELDIEVRIASIDGEGFPMTMDYRDDRVNIDIEDDAVVQVLPG